MAPAPSIGLEGRGRNQESSRHRGGGLPVDRVGRGLPSPEIGVVHAGEVVVHEGVGVDQLQGDRQVVDPVVLPARGPIGRHAEDGP